MIEDEIQASEVSVADEDDQAVTLDDIKVSVDAVKESVDEIAEYLETDTGQSQIILILDEILGRCEVISDSTGALLEAESSSTEGGDASAVYEYTEYETHVLEALQYTGGALTVLIGMFVAFAVYRFLKIFF